jgi:tetratricopeptide (TPR) repeat protein
LDVIDAAVGEHAGAQGGMAADALSASAATDVIAFEPERPVARESAGEYANAHYANEQYAPYANGQFYAQPGQYAAAPAPPAPAAPAPAEKRGPPKLLKGLIAAAICLGAVAALAASALFFGLPALRYGAAERLEGDGEFLEAALAFAELGNFRDSAERADGAIYRHAEALLADGDYDRAARQFGSIGDYSDAADRIDESSFLKACALGDGGEYDDALDILERLGEYPGAAGKIAEYQLLKQGGEDAAQAEQGAEDVAQAEQGDAADSGPEQGGTPETGQTPTQPDVTAPAELAQPTPAPTESLPVPTEPEAEHTYEIYVEDVSWHEARRRCEDMGGHLATVGSRDEEDKIIALVDATAAKYVWLGGYTGYDSGGFLRAAWITGEPFSYENWTENEPSGKDVDGTDENCLMMWHPNNSDRWAWNDQRSDPVAALPDYFAGNVAYICEYE